MRAITLGLAAFLVTCAVAPAAACRPGAEACPALVRLHPGTIVVVRGTVTLRHPHVHLCFEAAAGARLTVHLVRGTIKIGPGLPLSGPRGLRGVLDDDVPFVVPETGRYVVDLGANEMAERAFGPFALSIRYTPQPWGDRTRSRRPAG